MKTLRLPAKFGKREVEFVKAKSLPSSVVYRDSVVFQCCLRAKQDTVESPPPVSGGERSGWKTWSGDDVG